MWHIKEHSPPSRTPKRRKIDKIITKLPLQVIKKYELWKDIVYRHGPEKLKEFPGFKDEKLKGDRLGQRSSRLNLQYRVIYMVEEDIVSVFVLEINPHEY